MKVAIMGAGGLGAYTGGRLAASGVDVGFVARGAQLAALRERGLTIRSAKGNVTVQPVVASDRPEEIGVADIVIFGVKLWDTDGAAEAMRPMVGPHTLVLTFQNGIDSAEMIARHVPRAQVVSGAYYIIAHLASPGVVDLTSEVGRMVVESRDGDDRIARFKALCETATGLVVEVAGPDDDLVWRKFVRLTAFSGATALLRKPLGEILAHPVTSQFVKELLDESLAVALARGVRLPADLAEADFAGMPNWPPGSLASMAVDLMHGRRLELNWLSGRVHELGRELGVPTPAHTAVYRGLVLHELGSRKGEG